MATAKTAKTTKKTQTSSGDDGALLITKAGLDALHDELHTLKTARRKQVAERLKEAISYGDLSENSEYEEAKNEQAFMEGRILELEEMVKHVKIVDSNSHSKQVVEIGAKVKIRDLKKKADLDLMIVGSTESDPFAGKISNEAPLGAALLGSKVGDVVSVVMPSGKTDYEILKLA